MVCVVDRLKKGYPLEDYSLGELRTEFERLTGESVKDILMLAGKDDNIDTVRVLMSLTIEHANLAGAPRGQILENNASTSRDGASGSSSSGSTPRDQVAGPSSSVLQGIIAVQLICRLLLESVKFACVIN